MILFSESQGGPQRLHYWRNEGWNLLTRSPQQEHSIPIPVRNVRNENDNLPIKTSLRL